MHKKIFQIISGMLLLGVSGLHCADIPVLEISLTDFEKNAENNSPRLRSAKYELEAARERVNQQKTQLFPRLTLDGMYRYNTAVPEIIMPVPGSVPAKFGDNTSYSAGPSFLWTAWDKGVAGNMIKSAQSVTEAKRNDVETIRRQLFLSVRLVYFQVALAAEQVMLLTDSLKLSKAQYEDIKLNVRAGTKSLLDELSAHQELLNRIRQMRQSRADLASALRELSAVTGREFSVDLSNPTDSRGDYPLPEEVSVPTVKLKLETIDALVENFQQYGKSKFDENHPGLESLQENARAAEFTGRSAGSAKWPKIQLMAKSSIDYPFGNRLESYNQNTVGANFSLPLFEDGFSAKRARENDNVRLSALERKQQLKTDFTRDWNKAMDQLASLQEQKKLNDTSIKETEQLADIVYKSYKSGAVSYLEVQNANYRALEAKIQAVRTKVQMLVNFAILASLAVE